MLCARCTRFSNQIAGDPMIELIERGALQQVGTGEGDPFESYFSGNTIQICPVGALTSAAYRFRSRPFDLVSSPSVCEHCSGGCATRTDHRRGKVMRRLAANDPEVNEEWICDKGRFGVPVRAAARTGSTTPLVRNAEGDLVAGVLARGAGRPRPQGLLRVARPDRRADRRPAHRRGRLRLQQVRAGRARHQRHRLPRPRAQRPRRPTSWPPASPAAAVTSTVRGVTYTSLEKAPAVLLVGFESEEEAPGVFLRLRKAWRKHGQRVFSLATHATRGLEKAGGTLLPAAPGTETEWLDALAGGVGLDGRRAPRPPRRCGPRAR